MTTALIWFGASGSALIVLSALYLIEDKKGERVMLLSFRSWIDRGFAWVGERLAHIYRSITRAIARFILQHGVYQLLGSVVNYLVELEQRVERLVLHSHRSGGAENRERNHLDEIADHKEATSLTDSQKQQRRDGK